MTVGEEEHDGLREEQTCFGEKKMLKMFKRISPALPAPRISGLWPPLAPWSDPRSGSSRLRKGSNSKFYGG